jgi:prolyl-tRNA synthetase
MHDGKALQSGTSHNFGDGFAHAFGIQYTDKDNTLKYVYQTSWGVTTRLIGAIIMVHGDDSGLVLPPAIAPVQVDVVPIMQKKAGVLDKAYEVSKVLEEAGLRVKVDDSDKNPGWKFAEQEMRGIPVRVEMGPRDIEANQAVIVRRDNREKTVVSIDELAVKINEILAAMQKDMLERARQHRDAHTYSAHNYEEFKEIIAEKPGFVKGMWCGEQACEDKIKEETTATSRCMPFEQEQISDVCVCCGKPAKKLVYWGKAY